MTDYALLDKDNVVIDIVIWDGNPETWPPPENAVTWVDVSDPEFFVEPGGTLDPKTMEFVRGEPLVSPENEAPPIDDSDARRLDAMIAVLVEKGDLLPEDVDRINETK